MVLVAAGAAAAIIARSSARIGERCGGCLAKNPSTGAPRSLRGPNFIAGAGAFLAGRAAALAGRAAAAFAEGLAGARPDFRDVTLALAFGFGMGASMPRKPPRKRPPGHARGG